jgi:fructose-1,6-bisphosphatase/inositol monophosphatase family enzyme
MTGHLQVLTRATIEAGTKLKQANRNKSYDEATKARQRIFDCVKEELGINGAKNEKGSKLIVDPLDTEINYRRRGSAWAVHAGIFEEDKFVAGVIYLPETEVTISVEESSTRLNGTRMTLDSEISPRDALVSVHTNLVEGITRKGRKSLTVDELTQEYAELRLSGSLGADVCSMLKGEIDLLIVQNPDELTLIGLNVLLGALAKTDLGPTKAILPHDLPIGIVRIGRIDF